ncbi:odorant receptor 10-like [Andrena cerasifolii]|uniref:odorant receptor 10-like n=1 Tax=Andrena cerasifolii TaxID=2819439 RepID=UPI0040383D9C
MHNKSRRQVDDKPKNSHYEDDIRYTLEMCQWALKPIGLWHVVYSRTSRLQKILSTGLLAWCSFYVIITMVPPLNHAMFIEKNLNKRVKMMSGLLFGIGTMVKYYYLVVNGSIFERCIEQVERDWKTVEKPSDRAIMLREVTLSRNLISLLAIFRYIGGILYNTMMPLMTKSRFSGNTTVRVLSYAGYDAFFDTQSSPNYEIILSVQIISGFLKYNIAISANSLTTIFVTHVSGQIQIQLARLQNFVAEGHEKNRNPMALVIRDHVQILRLSKNVEEALQEIGLVLILESTGLVCFLGYNLLMEWETSDTIAITSYFTYLTFYSLNIFVHCYLGETLTEQCSRIAPASYNVDWYNLPPRQAYNFIMPNVISLYPPKLTAGKMVPLSMYTFSSVMQTSAVYLNLLRTVTNS